MGRVAHHRGDGRPQRRRRAALRFYEQRGLIRSERTSGNQRRYRRSGLRRVAAIKAAQALGLSLAEVQHALDALPQGRTPTR